MKKYLVLLALCIPSLAQAPLQVATFPVFRAFDSNGKPLSGGKLFSYAAGTTTPLSTFTDATGATFNANPVILDSTGSAKVFLGSVSSYKFVLQNQFGVQQWSVDNIIGGSAYISIGPRLSQAVTQPVNTNFTVNTSGAGASIFNGNSLFNGNIGTTLSPTNLSYANPIWSINSTNTTPLGNSGGFIQGDPYNTPLLFITSTNNSPNDATAINTVQNCHFTQGTPHINGGCVGAFIAAASLAGDEHANVEAINALATIDAGVDPLVQMQGIELNQFNNNVDSNIQATGTFTSGPYFGFSATAGGTHPMVAAFNVQDQVATVAPNSGWHIGLWVEHALDAGIRIGTPSVGRIIPVGKINSANALATASLNQDSIFDQYETNTWNGALSSPFFLTQKAHALAGTNAVVCMDFSSTTAADQQMLCSDGSARIANFVAAGSYAGAGTPTITTGAGAGTGPTASCGVNRLCDSFSGTIALTTGTSPAAGQIIVTVTFNSGRTFSPNCSVQAFTTSGSFQTFQVIPSPTNAALNILSTTALPGPAVIQLTYVCGGN